MSYDDLAPIMDNAVDDALANDVAYAKGGGSFRTVKAFVLIAAEAEGQDLTYIDPLNYTDRLKVAKSIIAQPSSADRIKHPKLAGVMAPSNWITVTGGRYWLIDLQKA